MRKGFTIVELVIVIAVIAILAGVLIPSFSTVVIKAEKTAALEKARNEYNLFMATEAGRLYESVYTEYANFLIVVGNRYQFVVSKASFNVEALEFNTAGYDTGEDMSKDIEGQNDEVKIYLEQRID